MKNIWFLYFDGGYERDTILFATSSEASARLAAKNMNDFSRRVVARLPIEPAFNACELDNPASAWNQWHDKHEKAVAKIRWPYGISMMRNEQVEIGNMPLRAKP